MNSEERPESAEPLPVSEVALAVGEISARRRLAFAAALLFATLLAFFGVLYVARVSPVHGVIVDAMRSQPAAVDSPQFEQTIELHTGARIEPGSHVELVLDGNGTFPQMYRDIDSARRSITLQMYYFTPGKLADSIAAHLMARAKAGIPVLMVLDAFGAHWMSREWLASLRDAGVEVRHLRPLKWYRLDKLSHRSHVRSLIVDGVIGYTGGYGFGDWWLGDGVTPDQWRETNVRIRGPAVRQLQAMFTAGWAEATGELLVGEQYFPALSDSAAGTMRTGVLHFVASYGSASAERFLALSIASARKTLYISNSYFIPDPRFIQMLGAAAKRGVDVRILTAGRLTDVKTTRLAARARYEELLTAGVRIYEYRPTMIHSKTFVVDGRWAAIGSLNFDNRSISFNDEVCAVVLDNGFGAQMDSMFVADLANSDEIRLPEFRKRGYWERFKEFAANLLSAIL